MRRAIKLRLFSTSVLLCSGTCAKGMQFYCPSGTYPAIPYCTIFFIFRPLSLFIYFLKNISQVTAYSPTSRPLGCPVSEENGTFYASFQPEEAGEWKIHVTYDGQDIEHSPFKCMVFNPRAIFVSISSR